MKNEGVCRLCGEVKTLTQEHVPPKKAFNDKGILFETLQDALGTSGRPYSKSPNGIKRWSLCEKCNTETGGNYGSAFVEWTHQAKVWLDMTHGKSELMLPYNIYPLKVIKQIVVMTLALLPKQRIEHYEEWRRFVLNPDAKYLDPDVHIYTYFNTDGIRIADVESAIMRTDLNALDYVHAEIALNPLGYCVTSNSQLGQKSLAKLQRLYDITWFSHYDFDVKTTIHPRLPVKEAHEPFPLDYRTKDEIESQLSKQNPA